MMQVNAGFTGDERRSGGDRGTHTEEISVGCEEEGRRTWLTDKFFGFGFRCNWPCAEITLNYRIIRVPSRCERASERASNRERERERECRRHSAEKYPISRGCSDLPR